LILAALFLAQAATPQAQRPADIEIEIGLTARRVTIERRGEASLEVRASPDGGSAVAVQAPEANGRRSLRNADVRVRAEARIADPHSPQAQIRTEAETAQPE
jgi:hypothetical protein